NELVSAVFRAMNLPETIDYIEMPDYLKAKYQYFTEADMSNLTAVDNFQLSELQSGVTDYVQNYLMQPNSYR
ncbi:MAG: hypothetical protein P9L91_06965, partial [Candidatus Zophobacter franzmannii]|nr:hypothetical protein [Candidatus Zophobacter franzmannii]